MNVEYLGDCHLGKKFQHGVPLHRRGERERLQFAKFERNLMETKADLHIQVGDLFDAFQVPFNVIWYTAQTYIAAKKKNPNTIYALLLGNHDASRDLERVSAFQIFSGLVRPHRIVIADKEAVRIGDKVLIPWHPVLTALEMVEKAQLEPGDTVIGHYDIVMGDTNQLPSARFVELGVTRCVTGHDHNARTMFMDGLEVVCTGSMEPYSHSEDRTGELYVTKTLAEVLLDTTIYTDKCLRIQLEPGEVLDQPIDCLQLTLQKGKAEDEEALDVDFEAFDMVALFHQAREQVGLDATFGTLVLEKMEAERAART